MQSDEMNVRRVAGPARALSSPRTALRWLALGGVIGSVVLIAAFTTAGLIRPGYSPIHQAISDLGVGSHAWLLNRTLLVAGVLMTGVAIAFAQATEGILSRRSRWICAVLLVLSPAGFFLAGIFTEAPATLRIHWLVAADLTFFGPVIALTAVGLLLRRRDGWRGWATYTLIAGIATLVLVLFMFWTFTPGTPFAAAKLGGLMERIVVVEVMVWYFVAGLRLLRTEAVSRGAGHRIPLVGRFFRRMNGVMRLMLRSPLHRMMSGRLLVITYTGRRTGRRYSTPVAYVPEGDALLLAGGAPWWRNVKPGSTVTVRLRGRDREASVERLEDQESVERALAFVLPRNPILGRFMQLKPGPDGTVSPDHIAAARARGLAISRLHLIGEPTR